MPRENTTKELFSFSWLDNAAAFDIAVVYILHLLRNSIEKEWIINTAEYSKNLNTSS